MSLEEFRGKIDEIDGKLVDLIIERMNICEELALFKKERKIPLIDFDREKEVKENLKKKIKSSKLDPDLIDEIYAKIFSESKRIQREVF